MIVVVVVVLLVDVGVVVSVTHRAVDLRAGAVSNGGRWRGSARGRSTSSLHKVKLRQKALALSGAQGVRMSRQVYVPGS